MIFYFCFSSKCFKSISTELTVGRAPRGLHCCRDSGYVLKTSLPTFPYLDLILPLAPLSTPSSQTLEYLPASIPASIPCTSQSHIWNTCLLPSLPQSYTPLSLTFGVPACCHPCLNYLHLSAPHLMYLPASIPASIPCTSQSHICSTCLLPSQPQSPVPLSTPSAQTLEYLPPSILAPIPCTSQPSIFFHLSSIPYTYFSAPHQPSFGVPASFHPCPNPFISQPSVWSTGPNSLHLSAPHQPKIWSTCLLPSLPSSLHFSAPHQPSFGVPASCHPCPNRCISQPSILEYLPASIFPQFPSSLSPAFGVPACFHP